MGLLIQLNDLKTYLQIGFTTDDLTLSQIIGGVSKAIESYCLREFSTIRTYTDILDGGVNALVLINRPISAISALMDLTGQSQDEAVGLGTGSQTSFPFAVLHPPLVPGSLMIGGGGVTGADDGNGNIIGAGVASGSAINYQTGVGTLVASAAVGAGIQLYATYTPNAAIVSPALYNFDSRRGLIYALPNPPADLPVPAGLFGFLDMAPTWGEGERRWQVNYTAGFADVPEDVKLAALTWCANKYNHRSPEGKETIGDYSYETEKGDSGLPLEVEQLLSHYKEVVF